jgi:hypothetical protein
MLNEIVMRPMYSWRAEEKVLEVTRKEMPWSQVSKLRTCSTINAQLTGKVFLRVLEYYKGETMSPSFMGLEMKLILNRDSGAHNQPNCTI